MRLQYFSLDELQGEKNKVVKLDFYAIAVLLDIQPTALKKIEVIRKTRRGLTIESAFLHEL